MFQIVDLALTWVLFVALFPISFVWLKRAYKIFIRKDYSEVALKRGISPAHPEKYAFAEGMFCVIGAFFLISVILGIVLFQLSYDVWTAMAGSTIISKIFVDIALKWQAHKKEKKVKST